MLLHAGHSAMVKACRVLSLSQVDLGGTASSKPVTDDEIWWIEILQES